MELLGRGDPRVEARSVELFERIVSTGSLVLKTIGGTGPGGDGKTPGFFVHPIVAVDAEEEAVLGLVGARIWTRGSAPVAPRASREIEDKESARWIEGAHTASERLRDAAQIIVTGDQ